ncbi:TIGR00730 family Rossman fold protein [Candidatus Saccharibacteria bacterium]|nr:TIGR00730 family Rossman fold protein [Candidatus Saccharibacteria bacterium]
MDKDATYKERKAMMDEMVERWTKALLKLGIDKRDIGRSLAYAEDLERGLRMMRSFPQGITIYGSARFSEDHKYYKKARELGQLLAQHGHPVITGGGPGIMEAANRGAFEYGGRSIGLNITLSHEQEPNPYLTDTMEFRYFFTRRVMLSMSAKAYVVFPGGFGTMDELTEILILIQEQKMPPMPVFFYGKSFWRPLERFYRTKMLSNGLIAAKDLKIFKITDDLNEIVATADKIGHFTISDQRYDIN